jgi:hypothetical protein
MQGMAGTPKASLYGAWERNAFPLVAAGSPCIRPSASCSHPGIMGIMSMNFMVAGVGIATMLKRLCL